MAATGLTYDDLPRLLERLTGDEKHDWSSLSTLDVLWVLHDRVLGPDDAFLLSKAHGPAACSSPPPESAAARSATGCRLPSGARSRDVVSSCSSATASSTRGRTGRRSSTRAACSSRRSPPSSSD